MAQTIKLRRSATEKNVPTTAQLDLGELAINTHDGKIYFEKNDGSPSIQTIVTTDSQTTGSIEITGAITGSHLTIGGNISIPTNNFLMEKVQGTSGNRIMLKNHSTGNMEFQLENSNYDYVFPDGKFGIGTTTPDYGLHLDNRQLVVDYTGIGFGHRDDSNNQFRIFTNISSGHGELYVRENNDGNRVILKGNAASEFVYGVSGSAASTGSFGVLELNTGGNLRGVVSFTHGNLSNTVIGYAGTGQNLDPSGGRQNTLIGYTVGSQITTGDQNVAIGQENLSGGNSTGNTAVGYRALKGVTTGVGNVGIGRNAADALQSGNFNIGIGQGADLGSTTAANRIVIGHDAAATADNQTVIGNTSQTHVVFNGDSLISGSAASTGSFGHIMVGGGNFSSASLASAGGGGGISNVVEDTSPQLGGDLDLNSNDITGTGNISITGGITLAGGGPNINGSGGNVYMLPTNFIVRSTISNDSGDVTVGDNLTVTGNVSGSATSTGSFGQGFFGSHVGIQTAPGSNELTVGGAGFVRAEYFRGTKFYHHSSNAGMGVGSNLIYFDDNNLNRVFQIKRDGGVHISGSHASTGSFGKLVIPQQGNNVAIEALGGNFSVANTIFQHTANAGNTQLGSSVASFNHSSGKVYTRKDGGYGDGGNEAFKATDHPVGAGFWVDSGGSMQFGHDDGSGARNTVQMMTLGPQDGHASGSLLVSGSIIAAEGDISGSATSTGSFGRIILPSGALADKSAPQLAFGDGNTGFFENGDNGLSIAIAGNRRWYFAADTIFGNDSGGPALFAKTATATQPVYSFEGDANTGIGKASADNMSLIAAGVEQLRIASNTISGSAASTGSFGSVFLGNIGNDKTLSIGDSSRGNHKIYDNSGYLRFDSSIWLGNGYIYVGGTFNLDAGANDIRFGSSSGGANTIHFKTDGSTDGITITQNHITSSGHFSGSAASTGSFGSVMQNGKHFPQTNAPGENIAFGTDAGSAFVGGNVNKINVAIGLSAGSAMADYGGNVYIGKNAAKLRTRGDDNVVIGTSAGGTDGDDFGDKNVFIGLSTGLNINSTNADGNVFIGNAAGTAGQQSIANVIIGDRAGNTLTDSARNVAIGTFAGTGNGVTNTTTENGVYLGQYAQTGTTNANGEIVLGTATGKGSNTATIGGDNITDIYMSEDIGAKLHTGDVSGSAASTGSFGTLRIGSDSSYVFANRAIIGHGDTNDGITLQSGATHQGNIAFNHSKGTTAHGRILYQHNTNYMAFFTNNSERIRIDTNGNFGIGTTSPSHTLHVKGPGNTNQNLFLITDSDDNNQFRIDNSSADGSPSMRLYDTSGASKVVFSSNGDSKIMGGDVGIGTDSPSEKLHVAGNILLPLDDSGTSYKLKLTGDGTSEIYRNSYDLYLTTSLTHYNVGANGLVLSTSDNARQIYLRHSTSLKRLSSNISDFNVYAGHGGALGFLTEGSTSGYSAIEQVYTDNNTGGLKFNTKTGGTDTERMRIHSGGTIEFKGTVFPGTDNTHDLGKSDKRWANIYSADLQLSNEGTEGNDVDGTTGSWTIQEGEEDLFIINRKTGKKYKFLLEEVTT